jgi:hypothetical protein
MVTERETDFSMFDNNFFDKRDCSRANCNLIARDVVRVTEVLVVCDILVERQLEQEFKVIKLEILVMKI